MTDNTNPDSLPPYHAELRDLHERIQKVDEAGMAVDHTMRAQYSDLHRMMLATLQHIESNLGFMSRKKLIRVVADFTTALNSVEEDYRMCRHVYYNRPVNRSYAREMLNSIQNHKFRIVRVINLVQERNPTDDHITDPNPDSLFNQGIQEAVGSAMHGYEQIYKELTAAALLAPDASFFDNPDEPGAQIMALRFDPHLEVIPSTEMDEEVEKSSYFSEPMFESESFCIWKMAWAKRCYVAAKAPKPMPKDVLTPLLNRNTAVWRSMKHPNILPLLGVCRFDFIGEVDSRIHFISPWMKNGNVRFYLSSNPGADRVQLIHDVALGLQYLHGIGVVHRNLKGSNVLVNLDGTAVISGFSMSEILDPDNKSPMSPSIEGDDLRWAPPNDEHFWGKEGDIWSWSMTAIEILSGECPFKQIDSWDVQASLQVRVGGVRPTREEYLPRHIASSQVWDLLKRCWKLNPEERISIDEVVADLDSERRATGWDPVSPALGPRRDWEKPMSF